MEATFKSGFKLGVTGGIGSGKTSVCRVFSILGIPVFFTDRVAREIMDSDVNIIRKINSLAGHDLYGNGSLDRMELASLIFNDAELLAKVNALVHPVVFSHFIDWVKKQEAPYVIMEAAILFESGAARMMDRVATIVTPVEERIDRVITRNRLTRQQVVERMKNQMDDETRIGMSDYVIYNSENSMILPAILDIHEDIMKNIKNLN